MNREANQWNSAVRYFKVATSIIRSKRIEQFAWIHSYIVEIAVIWCKFVSYLIKLSRRKVKFSNSCLPFYEFIGPSVRLLSKYFSQSLGFSKSVIFVLTIWMKGETKKRAVIKVFLLIKLAWSQYYLVQERKKKISKWYSDKVKSKFKFKHTQKKKQSPRSDWIVHEHGHQMEYKYNKYNKQVKLSRKFNIQYLIKWKQMHRRKKNRLFFSIIKKKETTVII